VNKARKISLAIEEFKQENLDYWKILNEKIEKHREVRRAYLEFGLEKGFARRYLSGFIKELDKDISDSEAKQFYGIIKKLNKKLKKKGGLQKLLLPE